MITTLDLATAYASGDITRAEKLARVVAQGSCLTLDTWVNAYVRAVPIGPLAIVEVNNPNAVRIRPLVQGLHLVRPTAQKNPCYDPLPCLRRQALIDLEEFASGRFLGLYQAIYADPDYSEEGATTLGRIRAYLGVH